MIPERVTGSSGSESCRGSTAAAEGDQQLHRLLALLGMPPEALRELRERLLQTTELECVQTPAHLQSIVSGLFKDSWFRLDAHSALVMARRGSRPGDPAADLLFSFRLSAYLRASEAALTVAGVSTPPRRASCALADRIRWCDRPPGMMMLTAC